MEPLISVVIPKTKEDVYLERCLNSIYRQTYKNIEIILLRDLSPLTYIDRSNISVVCGENCEAELNEAITKAKGEYIIFCSATSILSQNVLSTLCEHNRKSEKYKVSSVRVEETGGFILDENAIFSLYGKLFDISKLKKNKIKFETEYYSNEMFILKYLSSYEEISIDYDTDIYETRKKEFNNTDRYMPNKIDFEELLKALGSVNIEGKGNYVKRIVDEIFVCANRDYDAIMPFIESTAKILTPEIELNYYLAEVYVKKVYKNLISRKNTDMYEMIKRYINYFTKEKQYLSVLLDVMGISSEQYEIMHSQSIEEYLFYMDKVPDRCSILQCKDEIQNLKELLEYEHEHSKLLEEKLSDKATLEEVKSVVRDLLRVEQNMPAREGTVTSLEGPVLAEYIIQKYKRGNLGLKTIIKSLGGWIEYKIRK